MEPIYAIIGIYFLASLGFYIRYVTAKNESDKVVAKDLAKMFLFIAIVSLVMLALAFFAKDI